MRTRESWTGGEKGDKRERQRQRDRERETETDRQRQKQRHIETDRQTDRQKGAGVRELDLKKKREMGVKKGIYREEENIEKKN